MALLRKIKPMEIWECLDGTGIKNVTHKTISVVKLSKEEMQKLKLTTEVKIEDTESEK